MSSRRRFPVFKENSRVPVVLSRVSPINIGAISLGLYVFARGTMSETTKRHETIHYLQWCELGLFGTGTGPKLTVRYPLSVRLTVMRMKRVIWSHESCTRGSNTCFKGRLNNRVTLVLRKGYTWQRLKLR